MAFFLSYSCKLQAWPFFGLEWFQKSYNPSVSVVTMASMNEDEVIKMSNFFMVI